MRPLRLIVSMCFCLLALSHSAQSYGSSAGLRLGNGPLGRTLGATAQMRVLPTVTLEFIAQTDFLFESTVHLMIQRHRRLISRRLNLYIGAGPSLGREANLIDNRGRYTTRNTATSNTLGVDLIAGVEITAAGANISVDFKPNFNITGRDEWYVSQVGISVRQVVTKGNASKKRKRERARSKRKKQKEKQKKKDRKDEEPWLQDWWERNIKKKK